MELSNRPKAMALQQWFSAGPFWRRLRRVTRSWRVDGFEHSRVTFENGRQMQPDDIWVSIVVDTVDDHLYKADLLIRTLDRHASISPRQIIVHYVNRLPAAAVATFARMGCKIRKIEPFLDGKHCNKLQQLSLVDEFGLSEPAGSRSRPRW